MKTIVTLYENFNHIGGAEKVAINLHSAFKKKGFNCKIMARNPFETNHDYYKITKEEYIQLSFSNILSLKGATVISHHRKATTQVEIINRLFNLKLRIIHIAHNEFHNLKFMTVFPKEIIAVSNRVKENLISFFNVDENRIKVIYNGLPDIYNKSKEKLTTTDGIKILYPARITKVKAQVDLVANLNGKLNDDITIYFAGEGELAETLRSGIGENNPNFKYLGFVDLQNEFYNYDYVLLFSEREGLPLSLIEACTFCKPIICNDVGGNTEIVHNGKNGYVVNSYKDLTDVLNTLPKPDSAQYKLLSQNSRQLFEDVFSEGTMLEEYLNIIEK